MEQVRTAVGLGSLDSKLYAVGGECEATGHEGTLYLKSVECFDPRVNSWSRIPDMQYARSFAAVASFNGECCKTYKPLSTFCRLSLCYWRRDHQSLL